MQVPSTFCLQNTIPRPIFACKFSHSLLRSAPPASTTISCACVDISTGSCVVLHCPTCRAYKSVYGLKILKYRLNTEPNLKKIQTKYGLHLSKINT